MSAASENASVLLIGASRGLGYAIAAEYIDRGSRVVATVRGDGRTALHELQDRAGGQLEIGARRHQRTGAGQSPPRPAWCPHFRPPLCERRRHPPPGRDGREHHSCGIHSRDDHQHAEPMRVIETLGKLTEPQGTIAVMSSGQGSIANNQGGGWEIYRASKSALNQLMRSYRRPPRR